MKTIEQLEKKLSEIQNELDELKKQQSKYPMELLYIGDWHCIFPTTDRMELIRKHYMFAQLVETCKEWNRIDNFVPDWNKDNNKWCVCSKKDKIIVDFWYYDSSPICFKDQETAQLFLDTYRTELEQVKDLL